MLLMPNKSKRAYSFEGYVSKICTFLQSEATVIWFSAMVGSKQWGECFFLRKSRWQIPPIDEVHFTKPPIYCTWICFTKLPRKGKISTITNKRTMKHTQKKRKKTTSKIK